MIAESGTPDPGQTPPGRQVAGNSPVYSHGCKSPLPVAEGVAGKPSCNPSGRKSYFRYSSQGCEQDDAVRLCQGLGQRARGQESGPAGRAAGPRRLPPGQHFRVLGNVSPFLRSICTQPQRQQQLALIVALSSLQARMPNRSKPPFRPRAPLTLIPAKGRAVGTLSWVPEVFSEP